MLIYRCFLAVTLYLDGHWLINSTFCLAYFKKNKKWSVKKKKKESENDICHPLSQVSQTSKGRSFQLASCRPPLPAQRTREGGPHLLMSFGFNTTRGIVRRSALGECSKMRTLEWKLRMWMIFHQPNHSSRWQSQFESPNHSHMLFFEGTLVRQVSQYDVWARIRISDKMALASTLCAQESASLLRTD